MPTAIFAVIVVAFVVVGVVLVRRTQRGSRIACARL
jgi:preprotein translocase subunit SecG